MKIFNKISNEIYIQKKDVQTLNKYENFDIKVQSDCELEDFCVVDQIDCVNFIKNTSLIVDFEKFYNKSIESLDELIKYFLNLCLSENNNDSENDFDIYNNIITDIENIILLKKGYNTINIPYIVDMDKVHRVILANLHFLIFPTFDPNFFIIEKPDSEKFREAEVDFVKYFIICEEKQKLIDNKLDVYFDVDSMMEETNITEDKTIVYVRVKKKQKETLNINKEYKDWSIRF